MKWEKKSLDELGTLQRGRSRHRPRDASFLYGGSYPFVQTGDVKHANLYINSFTQTYSEEGLAQSRLWRKGTLCITIAANIADTAILDIDACFPDSIIGFVPYEGKSNVFFVKYLISTLQRQMKQIAQGAAQDNLSLEKLRSVEFSVPSFEVQESIASILSTYDNLIENNLKRIKLLEESAQLLYRQWFVDFKFPGYQKTKFSKGIPEGWIKTNAYEVMNIMSGGTPKTTIPDYWDGDIPFFTPKDYDNSFYVWETEKHLTESGLSKCNSKLYPKNTTFITARGTVGNITLAQRDMAMNQSCYAASPKEDLTPYFLFLSIREAVNHILGVAKDGVFSNIIVDTFKIIPCIKPLRDVINSFEIRVTPYFQNIDKILSMNRKLKEARDILLPRLMDGSIEV